MQHTKSTPYYIPLLLCAIPLALACVAAFVYYPSLQYPFQFDDMFNIRKLYIIRTLTLSQAWCSTARWVPFWINAINYRMGYFDPFYYRAFNVAFHVVAGIVLFFLLYLALQPAQKRSFAQQHRLSIATLTSALFLLHPVQTQTISYVIQGRMEGLAAVCMFTLVLLFIAAWRVTHAWARTVLLALLFIVSFFACGTKEIVIVTPLLLMLVDWFFIAHGNWASCKSRWWFHALYFSFIVGFYLYFLKPSFFLELIGLKIAIPNNMGNVLTQDPAQDILPIPFFISQFKVILHYLWIFIWPFNMSVEYDWKIVPSLWSSDCIVPLVILLLMALLVVRLLRVDKTSSTAFAALWFAICIAPRSTIVPSSELLADYKTYAASLGILFLLANALVYAVYQGIPAVYKKITKRAQHQIYLCCLLWICIGGGLLTYWRNTVWRTPQEFWMNIIQNAPHKARAYNNLGYAYAQQGNMQEAIPLYKKAIRMDPYYADARLNLAVCFAALHQVPRAMRILRKAIDLNPYCHEAYNNLATYYMQEKNYDEAKRLLATALELNPHYGKALFNLGKLYAELNDGKHAVACFKKACTQADADDEQGYKLYGDMAYRFGAYADAIEAYAHLLATRPDSTIYATKLAKLFFVHQQYKEALHMYQQLLKKDANNAANWHALAECYFHIDDIAKSYAACQKARALNLSTPELEFHEILCLLELQHTQQARTRLQQFVQNKTYPEELLALAQRTLAQCV
ncbi:MAG: tetratricopeptide repeat protein [Candidatus Babeliales bacterium]